MGEDPKTSIIVDVESPLNFIQLTHLQIITPKYEEESSYVRPRHQHRLYSLQPFVHCGTSVKHPLYTTTSKKVIGVMLVKAKLSNILYLLQNVHTNIKH